MSNLTIFTRSISDSILMKNGNSRIKNDNDERRYIAKTARKFRNRFIHPNDL